MRVSGLWIPESFWEDFLRPNVWIPTELKGIITKRQTRVYKALFRTTSETRRAVLISETAGGAHGEMPLWRRYFWPDGFDPLVKKACDGDADLVEHVLMLMAAAREGFVLNAKPVQVEFSDERPDPVKRARLGEGFLLARRGGLAIWMPRPEEVLTLFSKKRLQAMRRGPGEIARAVKSVDLHIHASGAVCCFSLYGARALEDVEQALMKSERRAAALTKRKQTGNAIASDANLSTARVYQLRQARGLAGPKSIEMEKRRRRVAELRTRGLTQREIARRLRITHRQVREVWGN